MLTALTVLLLASSGCSQSSDDAKPTRTPDPYVGGRAAVLLRSPNEQGNFKVVYRWTRGDVDLGDGVFAWRQAPGIIRLDASMSDDGSQGAFTVGTDYEAEQRVDTQHGRSCLWLNKPGAAPSVSCTDRPGLLVPGYDELASLEFARVRSSNGNPMLLGRQARCYQVVFLGQGNLCVDDQTSMMLFLSVEGWVWQAISFTEDVAGPTDAATLPLADDQVPVENLSTLELPDEVLNAAAVLDESQ